MTNHARLYDLHLWADISAAFPQVLLLLWLSHRPLPSNHMDPPPTHTHIAPNANSEILAAKYKDKASLQMETWEKREHKAKQKQMLVCDSDNKLYPH